MMENILLWISIGLIVFILLLAVYKEMNNDR